jgi:hypothetical protein
MGVPLRPLVNERKVEEEDATATHTYRGGYQTAAVTPKIYYGVSSRAAQAGGQGGEARHCGTPMLRRYAATSTLLPTKNAFECSSVQAAKPIVPHERKMARGGRAEALTSMLLAAKAAIRKVLILELFFNFLGSLRTLTGPNFHQSFSKPFCLCMCRVYSVPPFMLFQS